MCLFVFLLFLPVAAALSSLSNTFQLFGCTCERVSHPLIRVPSRFDGETSTLQQLHTAHSALWGDKHTLSNMLDTTHIVDIPTSYLHIIDVNSSDFHQGKCPAAAV